MDRPIYRLRWRFDYYSKAPIFGMWSNPGDKPVDQAWSKTTEGLAFASIEGKDTENRIVLLAQEIGSKFCLFKWMATAKVRKLADGGYGPPVHQLIGLQMVTNNKDVFVFDTGHVDVRDRSPDDMDYNYAAYGS